MARKASLIVILAWFNKKWPPYHMFNVKWGYPIKRPISPNIAPRGLECENNL